MNTDDVSKARAEAEDWSAVSHSYAAALTELSIVENPEDYELRTVIAILRDRLESAKARRDAARAIGWPRP